MLLVPSNLADIKRYYQNTYVKFHETGDTLYYINGVCNEYIYGTNEDGVDFKLYLEESEPYTLQYILPQKSFFQHKKHAALLYRIPARQYKRGITVENTRVKTVFPDGGTFLDLTIAVLKSYVTKQQFFSLTEARKSKNFSCVLTPRMALGVSTGTIFVDNVAVANVSGDTIQHNPLFKEDILSMLQNHDEQNRYKLV